MKKEIWYSKGLRFQCQGSGKCCVSRGEYGYVYLDKKDRVKMAKFFKLKISDFTERYCVFSDGYYRLKTIPHELECLFLKDNKCSIYSARPTQCRTWPFWPEVLNAKSWKKEVAQYCPGIGKGKLYSKKEIEAIAQEQSVSELNLD